MKPRRMSEAALMSPNTDILTTPKPETGGLKTPKFREFSEALSALRSPRDIAEASLNTPLALTTPLPAHAQDLSTPTLSTPRTADWGLFSPIALGSNCSSPRESLSSRDNRPADLPLDSSIGLSSPHDGILAKRRKLKNLSSSHSRSVESDSNSCDTPTQETQGLAQTSLDCPRDLTKKSCDLRDLRGCQVQSPSSTTDLDSVRDRVGDVRISSPKWFKHPKHLDRLNLSSKELLSDIPSSYHPSPLAVPSPNWTAIKELLCSNTQTPKVLDNFVFDVLPPNTPLTPTAKTALASCRERSPEPLNYEAKHKPESEQPHPRPHKLNGGQRVTFADCPPRPGSLTPPPPCPQDLSMRKEASDQAPGHPMVMPKTEYDPCPVTASYASRGCHSPPPYPVKEEPREAPPSLPPGFPPYYIPDLAPHHLYRQPGDHQRLAPTSPPASPPRSASNHYGGGGGGSHPRPQFYGGLSLASLYEGHGGGHGAASATTHAQYNMWNGGSGHHGGHDMGHVTIPTPWGRVTEGHNSHHVTGSNGSLANIQNHFNNLKPCLELKTHVKSEHRLSTESQDSVKKKARKMKAGDGSEVGGADLDSSLDGQPPKKKGKGKSKVNKDPNAPKRVFVCPHCNRSYDWNYNLNRHLKYECGKDNAFMCSKCGRKFPHKQNCVYHLKRKHKIVCDSVEQYVSNGLVVFTGREGALGGTCSSLSPPSGAAYSPKEGSVTPPPSNS